MSRLVVLLAFSLCTASVYGQEVDAKRLPAVKRVMDKAEATIRKNRKAYDEANQKALAEAEAELIKEADRLSKAGKPEEAVAVKKLAGGFQKDLVAKSETSEPARQPRAPKGAVAWNGHKYMAVRNICRWHEARKACEEMGGYLVIIGTAEEQNALATLLTRSGMGRNSFWIGATDEEREGVWKWVDGSPVGWTNWNPREPNNVGGEHYAEMVAGDNGRWNDLRLGETRWFICEWDE